MLLREDPGLGKGQAGARLHFDNVSDGIDAVTVCLQRLGIDRDPFAVTREPALLYDSWRAVWRDHEE
jgi:hypothetical protein